MRTGNHSDPSRDTAEPAALRSPSREGVVPKELRRLSAADQAYGIANQLEGYVDVSTPKREADFMLRIGKWAASLGDLLSATPVSETPPADADVIAALRPFAEAAKAYAHSHDGDQINKRPSWAGKDYVEAYLTAGELRAARAAITRLEASQPASSGREATEPHAQALRDVKDVVARHTDDLRAALTPPRDLAAAPGGGYDIFGEGGRGYLTIRDLCYTAFIRGRSDKNPDDGGRCDWFTDTLPLVLKGVEKLRALATPVSDTPPADADVIAALREKIRNGIVQARGALRLDAMCDDEGKPYGTTTVALEALDEAEGALDAALTRLEASQPASSGSEDDTPPICLAQDEAEYDRWSRPTPPRDLAAAPGGEGFKGGLEAAARWHEARAAEFDREAHERILVDGSPAQRDSAWARHDALNHRYYAEELRAIAPVPDTPPADAGLVEALKKLDGDSLDAICEVIGEGPDFRRYNEGKSAMRQWFLRRIESALSRATGGQHV